MAEPSGRRRMGWRLRSWLALLVAVQVALPRLAYANMTAPYHDGDRVTEPAPSLATMHIVHEDLRIDMRGLSQGMGPVKIRARYRVHNDGPAQSVDLFFVAPGLRSGEVRHDGRRLTVRTDKRAWAALMPEKESDQHVEGLSFVVDFSPGEQVLEVTYDATPDELAREITYGYAVDYEVGPARKWASFGSLTVDFFMPDGWDLLDLPRGFSEIDPRGHYQGEFRSLPRGLHPHRVRPQEDHRDIRALAPETFRFHVAPPLLPYYVLAAFEIMVRLVTIVLPIVLAVKLHRLSRRRGTRIGILERLRSFAVCVLASGLPLLTFWAHDQLFSHGRYDHLDMLALFGTPVLSLLLAVLGHAVVGFQSKKLNDS